MKFFNGDFLVIIIIAEENGYLGAICVDSLMKLNILT